MKLSILIACFLTCTALQSQNWELIWQDEFEGTELDLTKWSHDLGTGSAQGLWGWGNGELQYYQPDNTTVSNGSLKIEAREEPEGISDFYSGNIPYYYSSSKILTRDKFEFTYGKVEARIRTIDGQGYWPAFWMLPGGCWPETGEIDIMEQWGNDGNTNTTTGAAHMGNCGEGSTYVSWNETLSSGSYASSYHTYGIVWYEDYIGWYVDDMLISSVTPSSYPADLNWPYNDNDWFLILNLAITSSGINSNTTIPSDIEVDYVRVYQTNDVIGCLDSAASNYNPEATIDNGSCLFDVTFNVDMNCTTEVPGTMYVTGPFAEWCGECFPLSDANSDGIWSGTYGFPAGDLEYKYEMDNWAFQENLIDDMQAGATCAPVTDFSTYANRLITVSSVMSVIDSYGSCSPCSTAISGCTDSLADNYNPVATIDDGSCVISGCSDVLASNYNAQTTLDDGSCLYSVTFVIDMNESGVTFSTPEVNGTWNGWCGGCNVLSDINLDGIWEGTFDLPQGFHEFKFATDAWTEAETFLGGESCTLTTGEFVNRTITITEPTTYGIVCWEQCDECQYLGCTDPLYLEYDPLAEVEDGSCSIIAIEGCTYVDASNYDASANVEDLSCVFDMSNGCAGDFNGDGAITVADLTGFLSAFGSNCLE